MSAETHTCFWRKPDWTLIMKSSKGNYFIYNYETDDMVPYQEKEFDDLTGKSLISLKKPTIRDISKMTSNQREDHY